MINPAAHIRGSDLAFPTYSLEANNTRRPDRYYMYIQKYTYMHRASNHSLTHTVIMMKVSFSLCYYASSKLRNNRILQLPTLCLITKTEYLPYFIVEFKMKCLPAPWLSIDFPDTDLMLQFSLPFISFSHHITLHSANDYNVDVVIASSLDMM